MRKQISTEKLIEKLGCKVYPITIIKFLLNKRKILSYFDKAASPNFQIRSKYKVDHTDCKMCKEKELDGFLCRQHTSIDRVLNADYVAFDLDTNTYFFKNEVFRMIGKRLVIVYCPHPKLISGEISDAKVRKINPITIEDPALSELPYYRHTSEFLSTHLMEQHMKCWFNNEFSIVTVPNDRNSANWCLIANK